MERQQISNVKALSGVELAHSIMQRRQSLYNDFALPYEREEDFIERMSQDYGPGWMTKIEAKRNNLK